MYRWKITIKKTGAIFFKDVHKSGATYTYPKSLIDFLTPQEHYPLESYRFEFLDFD